MTDDVDPAVLADFSNRTVVSVENPRWVRADHSVLDADVVFAELAVMGAVPFSTSADADTPHGLAIWAAAIAGDYGAIAEFSRPINEQITNAPDDLFGGPTLGELFQ
jgi:hypothetical protein